MRKGIEERGPIAAWLITSRGSFREPGADRSWTVEQFLTTLKAETGWAPTRTTYARWESGAVRPDTDNLQRVQAFYASRGIEPHDQPAPQPPAAPSTELALASAITLLVDELRETRKERDEIRERLGAVEAAIRLLNAADDPTDATPPARVR